MSQKVEIDIERLLQWAFRDELPKQSVEGTWGYSVSPMFRLAALGVSVDESSGEPGFPYALGGPHADALVVGKYVESLGPDAINWPASRANVMGDLAELVSDNDPTLSALIIQLPGLVGMHAKMGTRPHQSSRPLPHPIVGNNGKPIVQYIDDQGRLVEGRTKSRHYGTAARCPLRWFPIPREIAFERLEYIVWYDAIARLAAALSKPGILSDYFPVPPAAPARPWETQTLNQASAQLATAH